MAGTSALRALAGKLVAPGKGILAADESTGTVGKRFEKVGIPATEENRRAYRELLFTAPGIGDFISGVIMFDETIRQNAADGRTFVRVLEEAGIMSGIKVDQGTEKFDGSRETFTKGLETLQERLPEYVRMGATFAKWRAVITIGESMPTDAAIRRNAKDLASYALLCQDAGLVPIVEPEVLMDGNHTIGTCREVTGRTLRAVFEELARSRVSIEGMLLKPNMVVPGTESGSHASPEEVADMTIGLFNEILPPALPGVVFLSGGQGEIEATENLNAINRTGKTPWSLSFSYGRALQSSALRIWKGDPVNVSAAQEAFIHRAKMNSLASRGLYEGEESAS